MSRDCQLVPLNERMMKITIMSADSEERFYKGELTVNQSFVLKKKVKGGEDRKMFCAVISLYRAYYRVKRKGRINHTQQRSRWLLSNVFQWRVVLSEWKLEETVVYRG